LTYARQLAQRRGAPLRVVRAWHWDDELAASGAVVARPELEREARISLRDLLPDDDLESVEVVVADSEPGRSILAAADDAQLVVVGRRRLSPLDRAFVGGVSRYVLAHATCPVVVIPEPAAPQE
jgi:nucleotide-binding universal stress UspA family protein